MTKEGPGRTEWVYINKHVYFFLSLPSLTVPPAPYIDSVVVEFMESLTWTPLLTIHMEELGPVVMEEWKGGICSKGNDHA